MNPYTQAILLNADSTPKTVMELMQGVGCWESSTACAQIENLVRSGKLRESHRTGELFQHRYFVRR